LQSTQREKSNYMVLELRTFVLKKRVSTNVLILGINVLKSRINQERTGGIKKVKGVHFVPFLS